MTETTEIIFGIMFGVLGLALVGFLLVQQIKGYYEDKKSFEKK